MSMYFTVETLRFRRKIRKNIHPTTESASIRSRPCRETVKTRVQFASCHWYCAFGGGESWVQTASPTRQTHHNVTLTKYASSVPPFGISFLTNSLSCLGVMGFGSPRPALQTKLQNPHILHWAVSRQCVFCTQRMVFRAEVIPRCRK